MNESDKRREDRQARFALRRVFDAAIDAVKAAPAVAANLPPKPRGRCVVVGAGKASAAMAAAVDRVWPDVDLSGVVSTRYGHAVSAGRIDVIEAGHPVPDAASEKAARRMLDAVSGLTADDLVIALFSGGGSATAALPVAALSLEEKRNLTERLLASGATIGEINTVRKHLSGIKGGKLAAAARPARVCTLVISDVPGDDPADVASGPTFPDTSTPDHALELLDRYGIKLKNSVRDRLRGSDAPDAKTIAGEHRVIASAAVALKAAAKAARDLGFAPVVLGDAIEAESRELGRAMAGIARSIRSLGEPAPAPAMLLSGGETTVTIGGEGAGRGGRNTEFLLALAVALGGAPGIWAMACDSDGIDGTEDAAGAIVTPDTLKRAAAAGFDPRATLRRHDSYTLFDAVDDLVVTGPTLTNVNDLRIVLVS